MPLVKERLPITYFEKMYAAFREALPSFFSGSAPDLKAFEDFVDYVYKHNETMVKTKGKSFASAAAKLLDFRMKLLKSQVNTLKTKSDILMNTKTEFSKLGPNENLLISTEANLDDMYISGFQVTRDEDGNYDFKAEDTDLFERVLWMMHRFYRRGKKMFRVEEQLMHELLLTDAKGVDTSFLQLPYPALCLHLPHNERLTVRNEIIEWLYISERVVLTGSASYRVFEFVTVSKSGAVGNFYMNVKPGDIGDLMIGDIDPTVTYDYSPLAVRESGELAKFLASVVLFMNSKDPVHANIYPRIITKKEDSAYPVCALGYGIPIQKDFNQGRRNDSSARAREIQVLKWTVRGHFRTYKSERFSGLENKVIWIRPFLKGRERGNDTLAAKPTFYDMK